MDNTRPGDTRPIVLVVDDELAVCRLLNVVLGRAGFDVWLAANGREAVDVYQHVREIALVLMDVRMPVLDGPATFAALRQLNPHVRCCFMTGDLGQYSEAELLESGAARIFRKPFVLSELSAVVQQLCHQN